MKERHSLTNDPLVAVQLDVIPVCRELGIGIVAYSPLGRGFLTGAIKSRDDLPEDDFRRHQPRFSEENFPKARFVGESLHPARPAKVTDYADAAEQHQWRCLSG